MQLTLHTDYALRLLIYLHAHEGEAASVVEISEAYGIRANHLAKVASHLSRLGWVRSARGRGGGLSLDETARSLTVGDVVRTVETNRRIVECFGEDSTCPIEPVCGLKRALNEAEKAFLEVLDRYPLVKLVREPRKLRVLLKISAGT